MLGEVKCKDGGTGSERCKGQVEAEATEGEGSGVRLLLDERNAYAVVA